MRALILLMILDLMLISKANAAQAPKNKIKYVVEFNEAEIPCLDIVANYTTDEQGDLILVPPPNINSYKVLTKYFKIEALAPRIFKLNFEPETHAKIQYKVCMMPAHNPMDFPVVKKDFFNFATNGTLVVPGFKTEDIWEVDIEIKGAKDFTFFSSNGKMATNTVHYTGLACHFMNFLVAATKQKFYEFNVQDQPILVLADAKQAPLVKARIEKLKKIFSFQRRLMKDYPTTPLLINFISTAPDSIAYGRHWLRALSVWVPENNSEIKVLDTIGHEFFHQWLGWTLNSINNPAEFLWLVEGVDDYIGLLSTYAAGVITLAEYVDMLNYRLSAYYTSPLVELTYPQLADKALYDLTHNIIAQLRGNLATLMLHNQVNSALENSTLIKVMKNLLHSVQLVGENVLPSKDNALTSEQVASHFLASLNHGEWQQYKNAINFSETQAYLRLPKKIINNKARLTKQWLKIALPEFDLTTLYTQHKIKDLTLDSPAYQAGLREEMTVKDYELSALYKPGKKITLVVETQDDQQKIIEFFPNTTYQLIPQYHIMPTQNALM
jgi:predicted metalloprotease with PDZ domain